MVHGLRNTPGLTLHESFLLLHGWMGSASPHWQSWLADALRALGHDVAFPCLPDHDTPERTAWRDAVAEALARGPEVVICHSLGSLAWMDTVATREVPRAAKVVLVAPPGQVEVDALRQSLKGFTGCVLDASAITRAAAEVRMVSSDADPYCAGGAAKVYARPLGIAHDMLGPETGHINVATGFGPWPQALAWCLGERHIIDGRL